MHGDSPGQVSSPISSEKKQISFFTSSCSGLSCQTDSNGVVHFPVPFSPTKGSWCGIKPRCYLFCHMGGGWGCHSCNVCNKDKAFCCPLALNSYRDCFCKHVVAGSYLADGDWTTIFSSCYNLTITIRLILDILLLCLLGFDWLCR